MEEQYYWNLLGPKIWSNTVRNVMDMKANMGLREAYDGDIAFASAWKLLVVGIMTQSVWLWEYLEGKELEELNWEQMKRKMKQHLQSQPLTCFAKLLQPHITALTGGSLSLTELLKTEPSCHSD
ncbi:hypothetical protein JHK82_031420 [Glycine max]|nr:hypothetical protein JHK82_031420 [Glycine max]